MQQKLTLVNRVHLPMTAQSVHHGLPWPAGAVRKDTPLVAMDENGKPLPLATRVLNCWPDGSVQWTLADLSLDFGPSQTRTVTIATAGERSSQPTNPVVAREDARGITVGNSLISVTILKAPAAALAESREIGDVDFAVTDADGVAFSGSRSRSRRVWLEESNPLRTVVRVDGKHEAADGRTLLDFWVRFIITANRPDVIVTYHYRNLEAAEPGINLRFMVIELRTPLPKNAERSIVHSNRGRNFRTEPLRLRDDFEICSSNTMDLAGYEQTHQRQGATGGGAGRVFIRQQELLRDDPAQKPWFLRNVVDFKFQSKDAPEAYVWQHIGLVGEERSIVVAGANMVGLHPKSLSIRGNVFRYSVWPEWAGTMDVTQGEGRTVGLNIGVLPPRASDDQMINRVLSWELSGLYAHWGAQAAVTVALDPAHMRACKVFQVDRLPEFDAREHFCFERKVQSQWAPDGSPPANGHWHYGDVFYRWDIGANNEEMAGHVWFQEYLRTGRPNCLERGVAQAQHIADVDICFRSADPYQNGGMCAHGPRHNHSAAYPSHMWFTELVFAYALTGDEEFKKAAARVCDNLVFWVNDEVGFANLSSDGRESGQPLINLSWVYEFVPDPRYLAAMNKIVSESFMARVKKHGSLVYMKPREDFALLRFPSYGQWAAWEGLYCVWRLTRDEELRKFLLDQLDRRLTEDQMPTAGSFRDTDFNVAAYAYYLSGGDRAWLDRVARPFSAVFRAVQWPFGYIKSMYFIKLAFEHGIAKDDDVLIS